MHDTILDRTLDHTRGCTACLHALHAVCIFMKLCHIVPLRHYPESYAHSVGRFRLPENAEIAFSFGKLGTSFHDALTNVACNIFLVAFSALIKQRENPRFSLLVGFTRDRKDKRKKEMCFFLQKRNLNVANIYTHAHTHIHTHTLNF